MSTMTLAQLRNNIALSSYPEKYEWMDAIDAELKARGEAVGCLTVRRFRGAYSMVNHDFDYYGDLPDGSYTVYTAPPAPKIEVTDAMVERALNAMFCRDLEGQGFCWQDAVGSPTQTEADMRAALEAALKDTP